MGIQDRDYYQEGRRGFEFSPRSAVAVIIGLNLLVWIAQVAFYRSTPKPEDFLALRPYELFHEYRVWEPLTANFLHRPDDIGHILANMLFLFLFGRELEEIYGTRRFTVFYLVCGTIALLAEAGYQELAGNPEIVILGASGAVMGTVLLFTLLFPQRQIQIFGFFPLPVWVLSLFFFITDLFGAVSRTNPNGAKIAYLAHLTGAGYALFYRFVLTDGSRFGTGVGSTVAALFRSLRPRSKPRKQPRPRLDEAPGFDPDEEAAGIGSPPRSKGRGDRSSSSRGSGTRAEELSRKQDEISARIDQLLQKISAGGKESLTPEELEYLQQNSKRYRSERGP